jgi:hypothetical protein
MADAPKIDAETQKILDKNNQLHDLVSHPAWKAARQILVEKILELQNVAEFIDIIQTGNATKLLKEMKANGRAAEILFNFLREIEGGAQQAVENKAPKRKSFIVDLNDDDSATL